MLSEKLYQLRRSRGLSQEQLAEQLNVSRQAVSKWESGASMPESEKLLAISRFFGVTLDELMGEEQERMPDAGPAEKRPSGRSETLGLILAAGGALCLALWGVLVVLLPDASQRLAGASMIRIDGNGIFLLLAVAAILTGALLLLRGRR